MQLRAEQLTTHLQQKKLAPIYWVSGDVPLLMQEACDAIRAAAQQQGYLERQVLRVETGFVWQNLLTAANTLSLFSSKQLLELRMTNAQPGDAGSKALQAYAERPAKDKILLISSGKIEAAAQRSAWYKALLAAGVVLQVWPIDTAQLPRWIAQRLANLGMQAEPAGIQILAAQAEGNLLAAQQEIEKLRLIYGACALSTADILQAVSDNARFDVFAFGDAVLEGDAKRVLRVLATLREEGVEPILILWVLVRELRALASYAHSLAQGMSIEQVLQKQWVWEKRKPLVRRAMQRHSVLVLHNLLQRAAQIDRMVKGVIAGNVWVVIADLALAIAGMKMMPSPHPSPKMGEGVQVASTRNIA